MSDPVETISPDEVAARLGVKRATVMEWARLRKIGSVPVGRRTRFTEQHVADFIKQHQIPADVMATTQRSRAHHRRSSR